MSGAKGLGTLSLQLTKARFATRQGESWLYVASIFAFAVCAGLALTVAGGTWMFVNRWQHPTGLLGEAVAVDPSLSNVALFYVILAGIACALVVPAMIGLAASAAVLGARGRERRLSALRLLGLSSGDVTRMSLTDTLVQVGIGCLVGTGAYLATLPLWAGMTMQAMPIQAAEMMLPLPLLLAVLGATVLIGLAASWWGLHQVRISPLGVARRASRPGLKVWRLIAFVLILVLAFTVANLIPLGSSLIPWLVLGTLILLVVGGINLVAPWLLQQISRVVASAPSPSLLWAARRIEADPKVTWRQASALAVLSLIGGYVAMMPITLDGMRGGEAVQSLVDGARWDFTKGAFITLGVGLILTATSVLITQASAVLERAEQSRAMTRMGAPAGYLSKVSWLEMLGPLLTAVLLGSALGIAMAGPMASFAGGLGQTGGVGPAVFAAVLAVGLALVAVAMLATRPLQAQVLRVEERRND